MARRVLVGNLYKELKDPNLIAKISASDQNWGRDKNEDDILWAAAASARHGMRR